MDASDFAVQLDLTGSGIMGAVEDQLLHHGKAENKYIRAELYKLNVYGNSDCDVSVVSPSLILLRLSRQRLILQATQGHTLRYRHAQVARDHLSYPPSGRRARPPSQGP